MLQYKSYNRTQNNPPYYPKTPIPIGFFSGVSMYTVSVHQISHFFYAPFLCSDSDLFSFSMFHCSKSTFSQT